MNFLFEDINLNSDLCGERFFVQCDSRAEALKIIEDETNFDTKNLTCLGKYHNWEAEAMGYDTYCWVAVFNAEWNEVEENG